MHRKDSHCSYCGHAFAEGAGWPRACAGCGNTSYKNPLPVAVLILPVDGGVLTVRRAVAPRIGELALPGGYINHGESWREAAARELLEEAAVRVDPAEIRDFCVKSAPDGTVLVFGVASAWPSEALPPFTSNEEAAERVILKAPETLAFPLHTEALREFFERRGD